jgi:Tfp pilus assembly protein PilF
MRIVRLRNVLFVALIGVGACGGEEPKPRVSKLPEAPIVQPKKIVAPTPVPVPTPVKPVAPEIVKIDIPADYKGRMKAAKALEGDEQEDMYEKAAEIAPQQAEPRIEIARLRLAKGDSAGARKYAEDAVELAPESSSAWNTMGRVELMDKDEDAAASAFAKAVELNPDNVWAWNNLGLALSQAGRWEEAVDALEHAVALDTVETYMFNNLGLAYEHTDRIEEARAAYKTAAKKGSDSAKKHLARIDGKIEPSTAEAKPE